MSLITLRPATAKDRPAMIAFWLEAWSPLFPQIDFVARIPSFEARLDDAVTKGALLTLALDEDGPAGFSLFDPATQDMDQLCVAPRAQGSGVARALLDALKRESGRVTLTVNTLNARARRFYDREGFAATGQGFSKSSGLPVTYMEWRRPA